MNNPVSDIVTILDIAFELNSMLAPWNILTLLVPFANVPTKLPALTLPITFRSLATFT